MSRYLNIIQQNLKIAPPTFGHFIWGKIKNGLEPTKKEYNYWQKTKGNAFRFELIENGCIIYHLTRKDYYKNGLLHRDDGPARIFWLTGNEGYYLNGMVYSKEEYWNHVRNNSK